jgi:steroid delta-isomerase-like uncharacterized protein
MSEKENVAIVKRFFDEVCNSKKLEIADEIFAPNHKLTDPSSPDVKNGPIGQKELVSIYQKGFPDAFWEVHEMIPAGDKVITRWTGHGTHKNELPGNPPIPPTGKKVNVAGIWIHKLKDGKIVESWDVWDTFGMLKQLGVIPQ